MCHVYYPSFGGNQLQSQGLSERLADLGEEVTVFTANVREPSQLFRRDRHYRLLPRSEVVNKVTIRRFRPCHRLRRLFFRPAGMVSVIAQKIGAVRAGQALDLVRRRYPCVPQMLYSIRKHQPDIVLANNGFPATTFFCYLAKKWFGYPLVIRTTTHVAQGWHRHPFQLEIYRAADLLIANTTFEKKVLVEMGIDAGRIATIGNGIDPSPFLQSDATAFRKRFGVGDEKVVAFVGRKVDGKGIDHLIEAMKVVWTQMPSVRLIVAGQNDSLYGANVTKQLAELKQEHAERLIDIDDFSEEDKPQIYAACDVFVMASNADSFGVVYLEAWASGKPVIACRDTPQETIISDQHDGLLVEYSNIGQLAEAIMRLLSDETLRSTLGENGRNKVLVNYTWDIIAAKVRTEYYGILQGYHGHLAAAE